MVCRFLHARSTGSVVSALAVDVLVCQDVAGRVVGDEVKRAPIVRNVIPGTVLVALPNRQPGCVADVPRSVQSPQDPQILNREIRLRAGDAIVDRRERRTFRYIFRRPKRLA